MFAYLIEQNCLLNVKAAVLVQYAIIQCANNVPLAQMFLEYTCHAQQHQPDTLCNTHEQAPMECYVLMLHKEQKKKRIEKCVAMQYRQLNPITCYVVSTELQLATKTLDFWDTFLDILLSYHLYTSWQYRGNTLYTPILEQPMLVVDTGCHQLGSKHTLCVTVAYTSTLTITYYQICFLRQLVAEDEN